MTVLRPKDELKDLWRRCFPADVRSDPDARTRGEAEWQEQRPRHLPLTRDAMNLANQPGLRYGSPGQAPSTQPTLLLMAGYSPEQLALVIAVHTQARCRRVITFTGHGVWSAIQRDVVSCLGVLGVDASVLADPVEVDPASPADVFRKLVDWIREHAEAGYAIDCTGGKKPMDSGAAHAASFYGLPAYYLDFDGYDPVMRRPFPWTCIYRELPLPEVAFGLDSRRRVFETFRARRFGDARRTMTEVLEHARSSKLFDPFEIDELQCADSLIAKANAWMDVRYHELPEHPLAGRFAQTAALEPRGVIEDLLSSESFDDVFRYLVDEYWRLGLLLDAGELREALVGLVGLAELTVERMFREAWFHEVRIRAATPVEWFYVDDDPPLPSLDSWVGTPLAAACLPPSSFGPKVKLLREGAATVEVWAHALKNGAELSDPPPAPNAARLVARVKIAGSGPLSRPTGWSKTKSDKLWKEHFGNFPQGAWIQNRHALAHLRAPLFSDKAIDQSRQAYEICVPRLMEALRRIHVGEALELERCGDAHWIRWKSSPPWDRATSVPWTANDSQLERWLRLRL